MRRISIEYNRLVPPFNEQACKLRLQNKPLWLHMRDIFSQYVESDMEYPDWELAAQHERDITEEAIVHRDNIYINEDLLEEFIREGRKRGKPVQLAFDANDPAIREHVLPLSTMLKREGDLVLAEMWYLPKGFSQISETGTLIIDTEARERGYYHIPPFAASLYGDLVYQLPKKAFVVIESWVHVFIADILFGIFTYGVNIEDNISISWRQKAKILWQAVLQQKPILSAAELVQIGENSSIHPTAQITGPAIIGNNVTIGAGAVIDACIIGDNVTVSQGAQLHISVVGDGCFLPFRAALFMTTLMENTMVAQNTCLQLCVVGRDTFIGAGTTFTDTSVLMAPLRGMNGHDQLEELNLRVIGGCVGHHCHLGSGLVIYPARMIESDVILIPNEKRMYIRKNVYFEDSDHHHLNMNDEYGHTQLYPRQQTRFGQSLEDSRRNLEKILNQK
ncbi:MAG: multidrug transporter [Chloroflexota bacterium]